MSSLQFRVYPGDEQYLPEPGLDRARARKQRIRKGIPDRSKTKLVPAFLFLKKRQDAQRPVSCDRVMIYPCQSGWHFCNPFIKSIYFPEAPMDSYEGHFCSTQGFLVIAKDALQ